MLEHATKLIDQGIKQLITANSSRLGLHLVLEHYYPQLTLRCLVCAASCAPVVALPCIFKTFPHQTAAVNDVAGIQD